MASGAAGDGLLRGVFDACISSGDMGIQRRPYHRNCGCALHESRARCSHPSRSNCVSYPIRRSWSEGCLALIGQLSPSCSPSPAAAGQMTRTQTLLVLGKDEDANEGTSPPPGV